MATFSAAAAAEAVVVVKVECFYTKLLYSAVKRGDALRLGR